MDEHSCEWARRWAGTELNALISWMITRKPEGYLAISGLQITRDGKSKSIRLPQTAATCLR